MSAIFFRFIEIALFQKGPQDLPSSGFLLFLAMLLNAAVLGLSVVMFQSGDLPRGVAQSVIGVATEFVLVWGVLLAFNYRNRFLQTMTAVLGVDSVISLAFIPLLASMPAAPGAGQASGLQAISMLALLVWGVVALGWILRNAVNVSSFSGAAIALAYHVTAYWLLTDVL
ncbi:MAG: hypothetical protein AAGD86_13315 [Pseudomonadota bacterium]